MLLFGLSGSLRTGSYNTALLRAAGDLLAPGARLDLYPALDSIPPYSEDVEAPPVVRELRERIGAAHALLIATPEYNASIPGQLKNAIDWASRPFPSNALRGKPAAVIGASTGLFGAVWAQADLRKVLATAGARVLGDELPVPDAPAAFDDEGRLTDPAVERALAALLALLQDDLSSRSSAARRSGSSPATRRANSLSARSPCCSITSPTSARARDAA